MLEKCTGRWKEERGIWEMTSQRAYLGVEFLEEIEIRLSQSFARRVVLEGPASSLLERGKEGLINKVAEETFAGGVSFESSRPLGGLKLQQRRGVPHGGKSTPKVTDQKKSPCLFSLCEGKGE